MSVIDPNAMSPNKPYCFGYGTSEEKMVDIFLLN